MPKKIIARRYKNPIIKYKSQKDLIIKDNIFDKEKLYKDFLLERRLIEYEREIMYDNIRHTLISQNLENINDL